MTESQRLGPLADPAQFTDALNIAGYAADDLKRLLRAMLTIRFAEEAVADLVETGEAVCPCHLGIGQEAIAVGVSSALRRTDRVYGNHRSHSHYLALGGELFAMYAEILGRKTGASQGMGGSMHLYAPEVGFSGSVPIVGATIPIAVGAGLAAKMDGKGDVAVTYFGDGACEEGVVHESLNMAAVYKLPVLFVCENNLYASHLDIGLRQPSDSTARFAKAHSIPYRVIDGNDVTAVIKAAGELVKAAREGGGPGFLEAVTFRWRGHVGPKEDIDVGVRRKPEILAAWRHRDPVRRLRDSMIEADLVTSVDVEKTCADIKCTVAKAVANARKADYPGTNALLDLVYAPRRHQ
ncbi:MAG: thiamine pyrophosphate-dependent dehydrogenase E1 component subunit alpha [Alphaproteobacteria bacterium]|nr:thiamine pyrophosphate-dependent dehydrogenase E1 component subunit alpha [Alphaproteobacteria bacterium]